jgi:hypothetical protein
MHRYELFNRNGALMCHAVGCRRHKKLRAVHGGLFCKKHAAKLAEIRSRIKHDISQAEVDARTEEALFRKLMEPRHMRYLFLLEHVMLPSVLSSTGTD